MTLEDSWNGPLYPSTAFQVGDRVHISPRYWSEPEPGREAIVEDPAFTSDGDIALVHPLNEGGERLHYRCTVPVSLLTPVTNV